MSLIGDNTQTIDFQKDEIERLRSEYPHLETTVAELKKESVDITIVDSLEDKTRVIGIIKRMKDAAKRVLGVHEAEKAPHMERGRGCDTFFFGLADQLARRDKKARPGEADRLNDLLTAFDVREHEKEMERRRREAEEAARKAREAEEARRKAEREAEEARLAAERARKPETQAAKEEVAQQAEAVASDARVEAAVTGSEAEKAYVETLATPADVMRTRTDEGLSTLAQEKFKEITDKNKLDLEKLRPYLSLPDLEKALGRYAESVGYSNDSSVQIAGARFGKRPKSRVY